MDGSVKVGVVGDGHSGEVLKSNISLGSEQVSAQGIGKVYLDQSSL